MNDCIFCKIINKTIPSDIVVESENVIVIKDISPKASLHLLIIPKKHIKDIVSFEHRDFELGSQMLLMAKFLSDKFDNAKNFRLVINNGVQAGQAIFHVHMHFLSGDMSEFTNL